MVLEGPTSSWDAPGSSSILQRSDGSPVRLFAGANSATNTASLHFHDHSTGHLLSRLHPCLLNVPSLVWLPLSHLIMWHSRMSSVSRQPPINLLPGYKLPKGGVYPLSIPECKGKEYYIKEALNQGFIWPSSSPTASSLFFVGKKDGGLCRLSSSELPDGTHQAGPAERL